LAFDGLDSQTGDQHSMSPKTTKWGAIAASALAFVLFAPPEQVNQISVVGPWLLLLAKFAAIGGLAKLGIEARDK
jgi:hypothetical protein